MECTSFLKACNDMLESKFIQSNRRISDILKAIAAEPALFTLFEQATVRFDFQTEFAKAQVPGGYNKIVLKYPTDKNRFLAFMFCLLLEFDLGNRELTHFLNEFYYNDDEGINASYAHFCHEAVARFAATVASNFDIDKKDEPTEYYDPEEGVTLSSENADAAIRLITDGVSSISQLTDCNIIDKEEMLVVSEALINCIKNGNFGKVYIFWIGYKNTLKQRPELNAVVSNVGGLLKAYSLI